MDALERHTSALVIGDEVTPFYTKYSLTADDVDPVEQETAGTVKNSTSPRFMVNCSILVLTDGGDPPICMNCRVAPATHYCRLCNQTLCRRCDTRLHGILSHPDKQRRTQSLRLSWADPLIAADRPAPNRKPTLLRGKRPVVHRSEQLDVDMQSIPPPPPESTMDPPSSTPRPPLPPKPANLCGRALRCVPFI